MDASQGRMRKNKNTNNWK